jgi:predicted oxidoreductase (fatty acid repression mutant protein)
MKSQFLRVEIYLDDLDKKVWELSKECVEALEKVKKTQSLEAVNSFYEQFGRRTLTRSVCFIMS